MHGCENVYPDVLGVFANSQNAPCLLSLSGNVSLRRIGLWNTKPLMNVWRTIEHFDYHPPISSCRFSKPLGVQLNMV